MNDNYAEQQEAVAAIRALLKVQSNAANFTQGFSDEYGDGAVYLPSMMEAAGIPVPPLTIREYERITGLTWTPGDPAPTFSKNSDGTAKYVINK